MRRNYFIYILLCFLFCFGSLLANEPSLKLKSKVEARNWKLSSKAYKQETFLQGASIELYKGSDLVTKTTSDKDGNFELDIPANGNYMLMVTSPGYNPKRFSVNSSSIPIKNSQGNYIPAVDMTGFVGSKEIKGVGDLGLNKPIVTAIGKNEQILYGGLNFSVNMNDADHRVIQRFCICNKLGDLAMEDKNYALAKTYYMMAMDVIPGELYPKDQLKKAGEGLKMEDLKRKDIAKKPKAKTNTGPSKQTIVAKPTKNTDFKKTSESGKSGHKVRRELGK